MLSRRSALLFGLFFIGMMVFNFPILSIFSKARMVGGIPIVLVYLFVMWTVFIGLTWLFADTPQYIEQFFKRWRDRKK